MQHRAANKRHICPKCGGAKDLKSKICFSCRRKTFKNRTDEVVIALAQGKTIKQIAMDWEISEGTVEYHWAMAKAMYGLQCHVDAVLFALHRGMVKLDQLVYPGRFKKAK